jgi:hypothetical protein
MKSRCLLNKVKLGLVGIILGAGLTGNINAHENTVSKTDSSLKIGARNESFIWSYGSEYHNSSLYVQVKTKVFSDWLNAYVEASLNNPVIRNGFERPGESTETFHISPNTHIGGFAGGLNITIYESKNNKLAFRGDIKYTQISEFYETQRWILPPYGRTDIHVNGIESIGAKAWVENNFNHFGWYAGLELSTTHARGIALTYDVGETQQSEATYSSFNQRDNTSLKGLIGANYDITKNWSIDADVKLGDGEYIGVGFSRRF